MRDDAAAYRGDADAPACPPDGPPRDAFRAELAGHAGDSSVTGGAATIVVYLLWALLDHALEPRLASDFLVLRGAAGTAMAAAWLALVLGLRRTPAAGPLVFGILATVQLSIAWMVVRVGGSFEAYLLGFSLALYGSAFVVVWHWRYTAWLVGISGAALVGAAALAPASLTSTQIIVACFYVGTAAVVALLGHGLRHRLAWREFLTRRSLRQERQRNQELVVRLDRLSQQDPLTGLGNRRRWEHALADADVAGLSPRRSLAVILCDIDRFKTINDRYGHHVGDVVLQRVAGALGRATRTSDVRVRLGGDELAVLCAGPGIRDAAVTAQRILEEVRALDLRDLAVPGVTVSIGVAATDTDPADAAAALVACADRRLYAAKRTRDAACAADGPSVDPAPPPPSEVPPPARTGV